MKTQKESYSNVKGQAEHAAPTAKGTGRRKRILMADDDLDLCNMIRMMLPEEEFEVSVVNDGLSVLGLIKAGKRPDVLILDMVMRDRTGMDLLSAVRSVWDGVKIIVYTSLAECRPEIEPYVDLFLDKSCPISDFVRHVRETVGK